MGEMPTKMGNEPENSQRYVPQNNFIFIRMFRVVGCKAQCQ